MLEILIYKLSTKTLLFVIFSAISLLSAFLMISANNSVYSSLCLVLCFIASSGILFLLECEFLALLFLIIYVGAIAILFLFVIMMLDIKYLESSKDLSKYIPVGILIGSLFFVELYYVILETFNTISYSTIGIELSNHYINWYSRIDSITDIKALGQVLYTHHVIQLLIVGLILLLSVIGVVVLTSGNLSKRSKKQVAFKQTSRTYKNILVI